MLILVVWRAYIVWQKTGVNALHVYRFDGIYGYVGWWFRIVFVGLAGVVFIFSFGGNLYNLLTPITWLDTPLLDGIGVCLFIISLIWIFIAQHQMGASWRIGIDNENETTLVTHGIYAYSRNPIFVGTRLNNFALFIILPNAVTLTLWILGDVLTYIQVMLEEEHLAKLHGETYQNYSHRVRRWL